jgi:hypothetical protein
LEASPGCAGRRESSEGFSATGLTSTYGIPQFSKFSVSAKKRFHFGQVIEAANHKIHTRRKLNNKKALGNVFRVPDHRADNSEASDKYFESAICQWREKSDKIKGITGG